MRSSGCLDFQRELDDCRRGHCRHGISGPMLAKNVLVNQSLKKPCLVQTVSDQLQLVPESEVSVLKLINNLTVLRFTMILCGSAFPAAETGDNSNCFAVTTRPAVYMFRTSLGDNSSRFDIQLQSGLVHIPDLIWLVQQSGGAHNILHRSEVLGNFYGIHTLVAH